MLNSKGMGNNDWQYESGERVFKCPTCRRSLGPEGGLLVAVDFIHRTCRCGRPWNGTAYMRLRNWLCGRKEVFSAEEASRVATEMRVGMRGAVNPYKCPFANHYHVGRIIKGLAFPD